jgi:hypothetical protein
MVVPPFSRLPARTGSVGPMLAMGSPATQLGILAGGVRRNLNFHPEATA